jgi:hypothetical protein
LAINNIQESIIKYLSAAQFASWDMLKKNTNSIFTKFDSEKKSLPDNLEYKVILPLLMKQ